MKKSCNILLAVSLLMASLLLGSGCTCGFDCSSDDDDSAAPVSFTLSFAAGQVGEFKQVEIGVDRIDFVDGNDVIASVNSFTIDELQEEDALSFTVNLLALDPAQGLEIFSNLEFPPDFVGINIHLTDAEVDSFVIDEDDMQKPLTVTGNVITLPGRSYNSGSREFVVDFRLPRSLQRNNSTGDYLLDDDEMLLVNVAETGTITGTVDTDLFDITTACDDKSDPLLGNRLYLYEGLLAAEELGELQTDSSANTPYNVAVPQQSNQTSEWTYTFGLLPVDADYTLAFACDAAEDDPEDVDNIIIPEPVGQLVQFNSLGNNGNTVFCDFEPDTVCDP